MVCLRHLRTLTIALTVAVVAPYSFADQCVVVRDGKVEAAIVDAGGLSLRIGEAISDLRQYVDRMSGAKLPVVAVPRDGQAAIHLQVGAANLPPKDQRALAALNVEGFILRIRDAQAWIAGQSDLGVQHGIYWLLEGWGCRWLFPGSDGEVVPSRKTLVAGSEMETEQQPFFLMRYLWYNYANLLPAQILAERAAWMRRNRMAYSLTGSVGHAYDRFVPRDDDRLFAEHPEYFPLRWGKRIRNGQICTCNPGVRELAVQAARDWFARNPELSMVSMSPNDGGGAWRCPECRGVCTFTDAALSLANYVADALQEDPRTRGKMVGMYAYFNTAWPPSIRAHDNVIIFLATRFNVVPWQWLAPLWKRKVAHLGIRDYASILPLTWTRPAWRLDSLQKKVNRWRELGVEGVSVESGNDWGGWGLYHYVMARLLWDPGASIDGIVEDYLEKGYRAAAPIMRKYFERWKRGYSGGALAAAASDLARARNATDAPDIVRRVDRQVLYLYHLRLLDSYRSAGDLRQRIEALKNLVEFDWRLAPLNIAHTFPLVNVYLHRDAVKTLGIAETEFEGWKDSRPFSPEEPSSLAEQLRR